jgi:hypothetical protein
MSRIMTFLKRGSNKTKAVDNSVNEEQRSMDSQHFLTDNSGRERW